MCEICVCAHTDNSQEIPAANQDPIYTQMDSIGLADGSHHCLTPCYRSMAHQDGGLSPAHDSNDSHDYHSPRSQFSSLESSNEHNQEASSLVESSSSSYVSAVSHHTHGTNPVSTPEGETSPASPATVSEVQTSSTMPSEDGAVPEYVHDAGNSHDDPHTDQRLHKTETQMQPARAREEPTSAYGGCSFPNE